MAEAVGAYHAVTASDELQEFERMRAKARLREEAALASAQRQRDEKIAKKF